jgi:hypothetical protein
MRTGVGEEGSASTLSVVQMIASAVNTNAPDVRGLSARPLGENVLLESKATIGFSEENMGRSNRLFCLSWGTR